MSEVRESTIMPSLEVFLQEVGPEAKSKDELTQGRVFRKRSTEDVGASAFPSTEG